jgi:hypothetical protein
MTSHPRRLSWSSFCLHHVRSALDFIEGLIIFIPGTVTYRVVQVGGPADAVDPLPQIVSTSSGFSATSAGVQQGVQAVLTSPINGKLCHAGRNVG